MDRTQLGSGWNRTRRPHRNHVAPARRRRRRRALLLEPLEARLAMAGNALPPGLLVASYLGGENPNSAAGREEASDVAVGDDGAIFWTGISDSRNLPLNREPTVTNPLVTNNELVVGKFTAVGEPQWLTKLGGEGDSEWPFAIDVDANGWVYVAGYTRSENFPVTEGAFQTDRKHDADAFVARLTPDGAVDAVTLFGGNSYDEINDIKVLPNGNVIVVGHTYSRDIPTRNAIQETLAGSFDAFAAEFQFDLSDVVWSSYLGGSGFEEAHAVTIGENGELIIVGTTGSSTFATATTQDAGLGAQDAFVANITPARDALFIHRLGGSGNDAVHSVATTADGNWVVAGVTDSTDFRTVAPLQPAIGGGQDAFFALLKPSGEVAQASYLGGRNTDGAAAIDVIAGGEIIISGSTNSDDFPTAAPFQDVLAAQSDAFLTRLTPTGDAILSSSFLGGDGNDNVRALAIAPEDRAVLVGDTSSTDLATVGAWQSAYGGGRTDGWLGVVSFAAEPTIAGLTVDSARNTSERELIVLGNGFHSEPTGAVFTSPGLPDLVGQSVTRVSQQQIRVSVDLRAAMPGTRAIEITFADGSMLRRDAVLELTDGRLSVGELKVDRIVMPGDVAEHRFFGRAGQSVNVIVNPGSGRGDLRTAKVRLFDGQMLELASATNENRIGTPLSLHDVLLPADGDYYIDVRGGEDMPHPYGTYGLQEWEVTPDILPLGIGKLTLGQLETPFSVDRWVFSATAGQQIELDLKASDFAQPVFSLQGPEGQVVFDTEVPHGRLVTLPTTGEYRLTVRGDNGDIGAYAFEATEKSLTELAVGSRFDGSWASSGQSQLFKLQVNDALPVLLTLDDTSDRNHNELYVRYGAPPTRTDFDLRFSDPASADQRLLVPASTIGDAYVLVFADYVGEPSTFAIEATASTMVLDTVAPNEVPAQSAAQLDLSGIGFGQDAQVEFWDDDSHVFAADGVTVHSTRRLSVTLPAELTGGEYAIRVTDGTGEAAILENALSVLTAGAADLRTRLVLPDVVGRHALATIYVEYENEGTHPMPAPMLVLEATDGAFMTLDESRVSAGFWTSATPDGFGDEVQFMAAGESPGWLQPGESGRVPVYYAGLAQPWDLTDDAVEFDLYYLTAENTHPVDWEAFATELRPDGMEPVAWSAVLTNIASQVGPTWGDYVRALNEAASSFGQLDRRVSDVSELWTAISRDADGFTVMPELVAEVDIQVAAPGLALTFARSFASTVSQRYQQASLGYGWSSNWDRVLKVQPDGTVVVHDAGGVRRRFQPDSRGGTYFGQPGDDAELTADGDIIRLREPDATEFAYQVTGNVGRLIEVRDRNGNAIGVTYENGRLTHLMHSSGDDLRLSYREDGLLSKIEASTGQQVEFAFDSAAGHLSAVVGVDGQRTEYTYTAGESAARNHALTRIAYADGSQRLFGYGADGKLAAFAFGGNAEWLLYEYPGVGHVTVTDAVGATTQWRFDERGAVGRVVDPAGRTTEYRYDNELHLVSSTDHRGVSEVFSYDNVGNRITSKNELGHTTRYEYNRAFRVLDSFIDANDNTTRFQIDEGGNVVRTEYADGSVTVTEYDDTGNAVRFTNRRDETTQVSYSAAGLIQSRTSETGTETFQYDEHGYLVAVTDARGTTRYERDSAGRATSIADPANRVLAMSYTPTGQIETLVYPDGFTLVNSYDEAGRLQRVSNGNGELVVEYVYNAAGYLSMKKNANGTYSANDYDNAGNLVRITNYTPEDTVSSYVSYEYDDLHRRTASDSDLGRWEFTYDASDQLVRASFQSATNNLEGRDIAYFYDPLGNRTEIVENGRSTGYSHNELNQYTQVGTAALAYDSDGNLVSFGGSQPNQTFVYDERNRLVEVQSPDGNFKYTYDAFGHRVAADQDDERTEYVLDPSGTFVLAEYRNGSLVTRYLPGLGLAARRDAAGSEYYYDVDGQGSVLGITDASGSYQNRNFYLPFGRRVALVDNLADPHAYLGQFGVQDDGDGRLYMHARYFLPDIAHFMTPDPLGLDGGDANLYRYAANDPVNRIDPNGTFAVSGLILFTIRFGPPLYGLLLRYGPTISRAGYQLISGMNQRAGAAGPVVSEFASKITSAVSSSGGRVGAGTGSGGGPSGSSCGCGGVGGGGVSGSVGSSDPNELTGPAGFGDQHFISLHSKIPYRIDFENYETATAPAQRVEVSNRIPELLDWSTLELTEVGFGDRLLTVPAGQQHFDAIEQVTYNGEAFEVHIEAGINSSTGILHVIFQSLDPTSLLPPQVLTGFLPPEDGTGRGMGHVSYVAAPRPDLKTGTEIRNIALITFDFAQAIATNQIDPLDPSQGTSLDKEALVTIDAAAPTSAVAPLPTRTGEASFDVHWDGDDDDGGAGIESFDIYVSADEAPFRKWLTRTTDSSAVFDGQPGARYSFYSIARDHVGNTEQKPLSPDAMTTVNRPPAAANREFALDEDTRLSLPALTLLSSAVDPDNDPLQVVPGRQPLRGTLQLGSDGSLEYQPFANSNGEDQFTFQVTDGYSFSDPATVTLAVAPVNDPPHVSSPAPDIVVDEDASDWRIQLDDLFDDVDDSSLSYSAASSDGQLAATSVGDEILTIAFQPDQSGLAHVTLTATDAAGSSVAETFTVSVIPVNDAPRSIEINKATVESNVVAAAVGHLSVTDPDEQDQHTFIVEDHRFEIVGSELRLAPGTYLPGADQSTLTLQVSVHDNGLPPLSAVQDLVINVLPNPTPWMNPRARRDTNDDGIISPIDVLVVVNELNERDVSDPSGLLPAARHADVMRYYDVNGDGYAAPLDVLQIVNYLNAMALDAAEAERLLGEWIGGTSDGQFSMRPQPTPAVKKPIRPVEESADRAMPASAGAHYQLWADILAASPRTSGSTTSVDELYAELDETTGLLATDQLGLLPSWEFGDHG